MIKNVFLLVMPFVLIACTQVSMHGQGLNFDQSTLAEQNLPTDHQCSAYQGHSCIAPILDLPPDAHCNRYQGHECLSPFLKPQSETQMHPF